MKFSPQCIHSLSSSQLSELFADCQNLQMIYWGPIDTSEVKNMNATFANCFNLIDLDLTSFDTCKVEDMTLLFNGCTSLSGLKWSNKFVTDNVKQAIRMFTYCWNLKELDLYQFKLSNVKTGGLMNMLWGCNKLQSLVYILS